MKNVFSSRPACYCALILMTVAVLLAFSAFSFVPSAHASTKNACVSGDPCVTIWATDVNVHSCASTDKTTCPVIGTLAGGGEHVRAVCQFQGQTVTASGFTNDWWMLLFADNGSEGWSSNIFIVGGQTIAGVPFCNFGG